MMSKTVAVRAALGVALTVVSFQATTAEARTRHHHVHRHAARHFVKSQAMAYAETGDVGNGAAFKAINGAFSNESTEAVERQPSLGKSADVTGLRAMVAQHAAQNGVPFALADAVVRIESNYNPRARNRSGAMGIMQIKAQTARGEGFSGGASALLNAETNITYAMKYLGKAYKMAGGDLCGTVMRYQSGHYATHMSRADHAYCAKARNIMARS